MFKGVYTVKKWEGKKTLFHKRFFVHDGLGIIFFDTMLEARTYISLKSISLKNVFERSKEIYKAINEHYIDCLVKFRIYDAVNRQVSQLLSDLLENYRYICKDTFAVYMLGKLKNIYNIFLSISKLLKMSLLYKSIEKTISMFFVEYPTYNSTKLINSININLPAPISAMA